MSDGIMALFDKDADEAIIARIAMLDKLIDYNHIRDKKGLCPIKIGVSIHTGDLMLGTLGGY